MAISMKLKGQQKITGGELVARLLAAEGVEKAFAFQAGREVRVLVDAGRIDDDHAVVICKDIAQRIQDELTYPGQIKVVVIREMRTTAVAK